MIFELDRQSFRLRFKYGFKDIPMNFIDIEQALKKKWIAISLSKENCTRFSDFDILHPAIGLKHNLINNKKDFIKTVKVVSAILEMKNDEKWIYLYKAEALCSLEDKYNKKYGRLEAFKRLSCNLYNIFDNIFKSHHYLSALSTKEIRKIIWECFLATHKMPRKARK